jgi:hypothetical protein
LRGNEFSTVKELISFVTSYSSGKSIKLSKQSISNLKHRKMLIRSVPQTVETLNFIKYVQSNIPHFDSTGFFEV